jgi:uncharacterized protein YciI
MKKLFVIILKYIVPLETIDAHRDDHIKFLDVQYANGTFIVSGPQVPRSGGVIMANAKSKAEIENILQGDPFFKHSLAEYQIIQFDATKYSNGFKEVFL